MIKIKRAVKWKDHRFFNILPHPYCIEMEDGKCYTFDRDRGNMWLKSAKWSDLWEPCSPLEVIVVCGTRGLE